MSKKSFNEIDDHNFSAIRNNGLRQRKLKPDSRWKFNENMIQSLDDEDIENDFYTEKENKDQV